MLIFTSLLSKEMLLCCWIWICSQNDLILFLLNAKFFWFLKLLRCFLQISFLIARTHILRLSWRSKAWWGVPLHYGHGIRYVSYGFTTRQVIIWRAIDIVLFASQVPLLELLKLLWVLQSGWGGCLDAITNLLWVVRLTVILLLTCKGGDFHVHCIDFLRLSNHILQLVDVLRLFDRIRLLFLLFHRRCIFLLSTMMHPLSLDYSSILVITKD